MVVGTIMEIIGLPIFLMFILEEAIQAAGFGIFVLQRAKLWEKADEQLDTYERLISHLETATKIFRTAVDSEEAVKAIRPEIYTFLMPFYFLGEVLHLDFLVQPFEDYAAACRSNAAAAQAEIAIHIKKINPAYYDEKDKLEKSIDLDKFKVKQAQDESLDQLARDKEAAKEELAIAKKKAKQEFMRMKKAKELTTEEYNTALIELDKGANEDDLALKKEYQEKERNIKLRFFDNFYALERIAENKRIELRQRFFPTKTALPSPAPKVYLWEFIEITPEYKAKCRNTNTNEIKYFTPAEYDILVKKGEAVPIVWPPPPSPPAPPPSPTEARLNVYCDIPAVVYLGEEPTGLTPFERDIPAGSYDVKVAAANTTPFAFKLDAKAGESYTKNVSLTPLADEINISGASTSITFGYLDPKLPLGDGGSVYTNGYIPSRALSLDKITDPTHETVGLKVTLSGKIVNPEPICMKFSLVKPDGTVLETPGSSCIGTPQEYGWEWWNWVAFGAVWSGPPHDILEKGGYAIVASIVSGKVVSGSANLYFKVI